MEMHIKSEQYIYSFNIPEFESAEVRVLAEDYTNLIVAYKAAVSYESVEKMQSVNEEVQSLVDRIPGMTENISSEDAEMFYDYMAVLSKDLANDLKNIN